MAEKKAIERYKRLATKNKAVWVNYKSIVIDGKPWIVQKQFKNDKWTLSVRLVNHQSTIDII